jgi:pilus assembly protein CpaC
MYRQRGQTYIVTIISVLIIMNAAFAQSQRITLNVGENKVIAVEALERVAVGDPHIADVQVLSDGKELLITGKSKGTTNVILWTSRGEETREVRVISFDPRQVHNEVTQLLHGIEGISIRLVGENVIIDGETITDRDFERVEKVAKIYPQVQMFLKRGHGQSGLIADEINRALQNAGLQDVAARTVGGKIFLDGNVASQKDFDNATSISEALINNPKEDLVNLVKVGSVKTIIQMDLEFVEINRKNLQNIGIKWDDSLSIGATAGVSGGIGSGVGHQFGGPVSLSARYGVTLNMMKQDGTARTLARPSVITVSGQKATFLAGGEVPIPLITAQSSTVQYKEFGLRFIFEPEANTATNDVYSKIEIEMSDIDRSTNVQGVPGFLTRRVDTFMSAKSGETIALSGLVKAETSKSVNKMPGFGSIPILGELFKSRRFNDQETELVVFVTPHIIESGDRKNIELIERTQQSYEKSEKDVKFHILD